MSRSPALHACQPFGFPFLGQFPEQFPGQFPRRGGLPPKKRRSAPAKTRVDHPVLFMGGFLLAVSLAVIGLWQGLGLLLPH